MPDPRVRARADAAASRLVDWARNPSGGGSIAGSNLVLVDAVAGAGKSRGITLAVREAVRADARVVVVAFTNGQVRDLAWRLHHAGVPVVHHAAAGEEIAAPPPGLVSGDDPTSLANAACVVATVHKVGGAAQRRADALGRFDLGFVDECYQVRTGNEALWTLGTADRWGFVGDPGQIATFTSLGQTPFLGDEDPVLSIVESSQAQGVPMGSLQFDWTWRLPASGAPVLSGFYGHPTPAAALPADRDLVLGPRRVRRGLDRVADDVTDAVARTGWAMLELPGDAVDVADPAVAQAIGAVVASLLERGGDATCERDGLRRLGQADVAVAVASSVQEGMAVQALAEAGLPDVPVRTYNRHQGLEYAVTVAWHPLSGVAAADPFNFDLGRMCVGVSRHRHGCVLVGRSGLRRLVEDPPLSAEAPWPGRRDRFLAGWRAHVDVLDHLDSLDAVIAA